MTWKFFSLFAIHFGKWYWSDKIKLVNSRSITQILSKHNFHNFNIDEPGMLHKLLSSDSLHKQINRFIN